MKDEYDFSKAVRGKFFRSDAKLDIPVYIDKEVSVFVDKIALRKGADRSSVVNEILRGDIIIAEAMQ